MAGPTDQSVRPSRPGRAASLVGSYELLLWLIRTAAPRAVAREPAADQADGPADHPVAGLRLMSEPDLDVPENQGGPANHAKPGGPVDRCVGPFVGADWASGPGWPGMGHAYRPSDHEETGPQVAKGVAAASENSEEEINVAAVAAYRVSIDSGKPLSERKLAAMFSKKSRRWARNRMAEAHQVAIRSATAGARVDTGVSCSRTATVSTCWPLLRRPWALGQPVGLASLCNPVGSRFYALIFPELI